MSAHVAEKPLDHDEAPTGPAAAAATAEVPAPPAEGAADETAALQERLGGYFNGALTANLIHLGDRSAQGTAIQGPGGVPPVGVPCHPREPASQPPPAHPTPGRPLPDLPRLQAGPVCSPEGARPLHRLPAGRGHRHTGVYYCSVHRMHAAVHPVPARGRRSSAKRRRQRAWAGTRRAGSAGCGPHHPLLTPLEDLFRCFTDLFHSCPALRPTLAMTGAGRRALRAGVAAPAGGGPPHPDRLSRREVLADPRTAGGRAAGAPPGARACPQPRPREQGSAASSNRPGRAGLPGPRAAVASASASMP